jgi:bifunctional ADP-heptose synthase (sugar kinase/adenylyltransferase)
MIVVVGDLILDTYAYYETVKQSPEGSHPIVKFLRKENHIGGAGGVNLMVGAMGVECQYVQVTIPTSIKNRIIVDDRVTMRIDQDVVQPIPRDIAAKVIHTIIQYNPSTLIVADYGKGVLTDELWYMIRQLAPGVRIIVDPYPTRPLTFYEGKGIILCPNRRDLGFPQQVIASDVLEKLSILRTRFEHICLKLDHQGMMITTKKVNGSPDYLHIPPKEVTVRDVCGAGDMVSASLAVMLDRGESWEEACIFANAMAAEKCRRWGPATVKVSDVFPEVTVEVPADIYSADGAPKPPQI